MTRGKVNGNGRVEVPNWVLATQYVLSWSFAASLLWYVITEKTEHPALIIVTIIYLAFWPVFQVSPGEMIRSIFPR